MEYSLIGDGYHSDKWWMRILLTNHFPFHGSGTGTYVRDLATYLTVLGHEVRALIVDGQRRREETNSRGNGSKATLDPCLTTRIVCNALSRNADLAFDFPCFTAHPYSHTTFYQLSAKQINDYLTVTKKFLNKMIAEFVPDVVHCQHIWVQGALLGGVGVPFVISAQGTDLIGYRRDARFRHLANTAAINCHRILAASHHIRQQVVSTFPCVDSKTQTLLSSVDVSPYTLPAEPRDSVLRKLGIPLNSGPIVAFLGKLVPFKGVEVLLEAARLYTRLNLGICTVICGDGPLREKLESQVVDLNPKRVWFLGDRPLHERAQLLKYTDLVVVPSLEEPFGLVVLEAMASGVPVVATRAGGLTEIVDEDRGALINPGNPVELAQAVVRAISGDWKSKKGEAAKRYVKSNHDPLTWAVYLESVYREVYEEHNNKS